MDVFGEFFVCNGKFTGISCNIFLSDDYRLIFNKNGFPAVERPRTDLGAFGIEEKSDRQVQFPADALYPVHTHLMFFVGAV